MPFKLMQKYNQAEIYLIGENSLKVLTGLGECLFLLTP